jgi:hypothetical protein
MFFVQLSQRGLVREKKRWLDHFLFRCPSRCNDML